MKSAKDRIILPLDVSSLEEAEKIVQLLGPYIGMFKVGLELFTACGPDAVRMVHDHGQSAFLDLKFKDIPPTVGRAAAQAAKLGVAMFNVHASNQEAAIRAAAENRGNALLLGVTVLTSMTDEDCLMVYNSPMGQSLMRFAGRTKRYGAQGIICSPRDLQLMKNSHVSDLVFVTPGVRPAWADANEQARFMTPKEAIRVGADYLVIGRPITNPPPNIGGPVDAALRIAEEIHQGLTARNPALGVK